MKKSLLILVILFTTQLHAADYYWVGGGGNWSDLNHWRLGSTAGAIPSIVPSSADNVFFTAGSGFGATPATRTVTLNANGFCNNMTWESGVPNNPIFNTANVAFTVEVWGSMVLAPTVSYTCIFEFKGATPATITTNGTVQGPFGLDIDKPGSSLTVTDSLIVPSNAAVATNQISLTAGTFNIAGIKLAARMIVSNNSNVRVINMANSDLNLYYSFDYRGSNQTVNASGSNLFSGRYLMLEGGVYNKVSNNGFDVTHFFVYNCTFSSLTYVNTSATSYARIHNSNTADTIRFMGAGSIGSNNNVNVIVAEGGFFIGNSNIVNRVICNNYGAMGDDNDITYWQNGGPFTVSGNGTNNVDSLLLTPGKIIAFRGTFNVNKYLKLDGNTCDAFSEVSGEPVSGSLNFAPGATALMNNMILTGLNATGPITPLAVDGIDNGANTGFTITPPASASGTRYWVGGAGDWNDRSHWSATSGGAGGACIPYIGDDVVFDANSGFTAGNNTVTTSSTSFCHNMTWAPGVSTAIFNESTGYVFRIYGSLVMQPAATLNALMEFHGSDPASITTNGNTTGGVQFIIVKTNGAVVTLSDNWNNPSGGSFVHRSGGLNLAGRTVSVQFYDSYINAARSLDITNATLNLTDYDYRGTGKTIASTGSHITTARGVAVDGLTYPWVDANYAGTGSFFDINNTTFGQLTFNATGTTVNADVEQGNTIRRLEYKGKGFITGSGNTIDSLILAGSRNYFFGGTNTITRYLKAQSAPCAGLGEIRNYVPGATATLNFSAGAVVDMANVYLQNIIASGPITPIAFSGADAGGNSGWNITVAPGSPRYWIGGAGDWNDAAHWSTASGGAPGACIPTVYDDVYFDANSGFTAASKTVTVNNGNAYCRNVNWTGAANSPVWSKSVSWAIEAWGDSVITIPTATFTVSPLVLKGVNATYMKGAAPLGGFDVTIDKAGGSLTLLNDYSNVNTAFLLTNGTFNAPGRTLNVLSISNAGAATASGINISNANITTGTWNYSGAATNHSLNSANSTITATAFTATGLIYNKVNISSTTNTASFNGTTVDSLVFTNTGTANTVGISGTPGSNFNYVEYKGSGNVYSTGNTIDTLVFFPGKIYTLTNGTNTTITGEWFASGTPCNLTEIVSSSATANATITKLNGAPAFDYIRVRRITAAGAVPFVAFNHTIDQGNNINWNIAPYNGAAPIYGLGPDTAVLPANFPITLRTDGFFGAPGSQYTWNDNSTADTLQVAGPGTYYVSVSFPDGCTIRDTIIVTEATILPVNLISFTGTPVDCQSRLSWKVTDAINFSHFEVEKSKDGYTYTKAAEIPLTAAEDYGWTDPSGDNSISYYRLKMVHIGEAATYSNIVRIKNNCQEPAVKIYPTITDNQVQVILPAGYEHATIQVYNTRGQQVSPLITGTGSQRTVYLQGLPKAAYVLQVINGTERKSFSIIKP